MLLILPSLWYSQASRFLFRFLFTRLSVNKEGLLKGESGLIPPPLSSLPWLPSHSVKLTPSCGTPIRLYILFTSSSRMLSSCTRCSSYTDLVRVPQTLHSCSGLRTFALAVASARIVPPQTDLTHFSPPSGLYSNVALSRSSSLAIPLK